MSVDVIVVSYNTRDLLRACLASVERAQRESEQVRVFVVDNASRDGSADMVRREFSQATLIALDRNIGFGPANNQALRAGNGEHLLFLNSDAELKPGALPALLGVFEAYPRCVVVGPRLEYPGGRFQPSCRRFPTLLRSIWNAAGLQRRFPGRLRALHSWLSEQEHAPGAVVDMVSGACFLMRRSYLESIGGFDENIFLYEEEMDIMLPARRQGREVRYCAEAVVVHHHGASSGEHDASDASLLHLYRSKYYVYRKHYGTLIAWMTFATDYAIFQFSVLWNILRGTQSPASRDLEFCIRGHRESRHDRHRSHVNT